MTTPDPLEGHLEVTSDDYVYWADARNAEIGHIFVRPLSSLTQTDAIRIREDAYAALARVARDAARFAEMRVALDRLLADLAPKGGVSYYDEVGRPVPVMQPYSDGMQAALQLVRSVLYPASHDD